ncbi:MAG: SIS domain-containing protein [Armatimonadota bacterium]|jgi:D-sedoheptulose 7-phosphate isomerase|nr:phosphoheptose isomerase [Armatimonadota bacterium]
MDMIDAYLKNVAGLISDTSRSDLMVVADILVDAYKSDAQVFIMGNGGSASTASHMACDLQKTIGLHGNRKFRVMALTDSSPLMTAWANDFDYSDIFSRQLEAWVGPGDVVIAISGSGNSKNVLKAVDYANKSGATSIGMSGFRGGQLVGICHYNIVVPSNDMQHIEDLHMVFAHLLFRYILDEMHLPEDLAA